MRREGVKSLVGEGVKSLVGEGVKSLVESFRFTISSPVISNAFLSKNPDGQKGGKISLFSQPKI